MEITDRTVAADPEVAVRIYRPHQGLARSRTDGERTRPGRFVAAAAQHRHRMPRPHIPTAAVPTLEEAAIRAVHGVGSSDRRATKTQKG
jgi:hypothetical protein